MFLSCLRLCHQTLRTPRFTPSVTQDSSRGSAAGNAHAAPRSECGGGRVWAVVSAPEDGLSRRQRDAQAALRAPRRQGWTCLWPEVALQDQSRLGAGLCRRPVLSGPGFARDRRRLQAMSREAVVVTGQEWVCAPCEDSPHPQLDSGPQGAHSHPGLRLPTGRGGVGGRAGLGRPGGAASPGPTVTGSG